MTNHDSEYLSANEYNEVYMIEAFSTAEGVFNIAFTVDGISTGSTCYSSDSMVGNTSLTVFHCPMLYFNSYDVLFQYTAPVNYSGAVEVNVNIQSGLSGSRSETVLDMNVSASSSKWSVSGSAAVANSLHPVVTTPASVRVSVLSMSKTSDVVLPLNKQGVVISNISVTPVDPLVSASVCSLMHVTLSTANNGVLSLPLRSALRAGSVSSANSTVSGILYSDMLSKKLPSITITCVLCGTSGISASLQYALDSVVYDYSNLTEVSAESSVSSSIKEDVLSISVVVGDVTVESTPVAIKIQTMNSGSSEANHYQGGYFSLQAESGSENVNVDSTGVAGLGSVSLHTSPLLSTSGTGVESNPVQMLLSTVTTGAAPRAANSGNNHAVVSSSEDPGSNYYGDVLSLTSGISSVNDPSHPLERTFLMDITVSGDEAAVAGDGVGYNYTVPQSQILYSEVPWRKEVQAIELYYYALKTTTTTVVETENDAGMYTSEELVVDDVSEATGINSILASSLSFDFDMEFTSYGITDRSGISVINADFLSMGSRMEHLLNSFSHINDASVRVLYPNATAMADYNSDNVISSIKNVGDGNTTTIVVSNTTMLLATMYVTFHANTGDVPLLSMSSSTPSGRSGDYSAERDATGATYTTTDTVTRTVPTSTISTVTTVTTTETEVSGSSIVPSVKEVVKGDLVAEVQELVIQVPFNSSRYTSDALLSSQMSFVFTSVPISDHLDRDAFVELAPISLNASAEELEIYLNNPLVLATGQGNVGYVAVT